MGVKVTPVYECSKNLLMATTAKAAAKHDTMKYIAMTTYVYVNIT